MITRCLALTHQRHRCEANSINGTGYCAEHAHFAPTSPLLPSPNRRGGGEDDGLLAKFLKRSDPNEIPDDARNAIASSLKKKSTLALGDILYNDPNSFTRWSAAYAIRKRRDHSAIESLWDVLHREPVAMVRQQCVVALGKIGTSAAIGPLIEALWHDRDAGVRQASAIALGNLGITQVSQELLDVLGREHSAFVRWDCVVALGQIGNESAEPPLSQHSLSERAQVIRAACVEAIEAIRQRAVNLCSPGHVATKDTRK